MLSEDEARSEGHLKKARSKMNGPFLLNCIKFQKQNMSRQFSFFITLVLLGQAILAQKDGLSFLALGDSYTASTGELHSNGWPAQLVKTLADKGIKIKNPTIIAGAGWTTSELIEQIEKKEPVAENDLVGLLIGVNNQYRGIDILIFKKNLFSYCKPAYRWRTMTKQRFLCFPFPIGGQPRMPSARTGKKSVPS